MKLPGAATPFARLLLLSLAAVAPGCGSSPERPDILLVTIDTLRADRLGSYGYPRPLTPHLDQLAAEGVRFHNAVAQIPETLPSITSLMTSSYPVDHGVRDNWNVLPTETQTLATTLREHGYSTAAFVSSIVLRSQAGLSAGFDLYDEAFPDAFLERERAQRRADETTDAVLGWLRGPAASSEQPLFAWVHYNDPHALYLPPPAFADRFRDPDYSGPVIGDPVQFREIRHHRLPLDDADLRFMRDSYDAEIAFLDSQIGRLLEGLEALGLGDALIVVTADHGESLGEHNYYFDHGDFLFENQLRVPLIMRHARLPAGSAVDWQVQSVDVLPTLLDLAEIDPPEAVRGTSLLALAGGAPPIVKSLAYAESDSCQKDSPHPCGPPGIPGKLYSMRTDRWKAVLYPDGDLDLWDLRADPAETIDRSTDEPELAAFLRAEIERTVAGQTVEQRGEIDPETLEILKALGYLE